MLVGKGTHNRANGKAVKVVINKDEDAQCNGGELSTYTGLDIGLSPAAKGSAAAGTVHQANHYAQYYQEYQYAHIVFVGQNGYYAALEYMGKGSLKGKIGVEQAAGQHADKQGRIYFLGDEGKGYCNDGGKQCPECIVEAGYLRVGTGAGGSGRYYKNEHSQDRHYKDEPWVASGGSGFHGGCFLLKNIKN